MSTETKTKPSVLIIDDDAITCETLSYALSQNDFQVASTSNGKDGLEKFTASKYDVVLLDIKLPDIDGTDLLLKFKSLRPEVVYIFITGHASVQNARKAMEQGASGYFVKPLVLDDILLIIKEALEKSRLQQEVAQSAQKLRNIIDSTFDAIISVDRFGKIVQWNKAATTLFGYSAEEVLNKNGDILLFPENKEYLIQQIIDHFNRGESLEIIGRKRNGERIFMELNFGKWQEKEDILYTGVIRDISGRKREEEERNKLQELLQQAQKLEAIGTLAGGIAHDFNNILTAIIGYANLLKESLPAGSREMDDLEQVLQGGERARNLVKQILAFSRIGEQKIQPVQVHLILKETLRLLRATIPSSIEIHQIIETKNSTIMTDPTQIHQVIMNLCTNAYHAMRNSHGILTIILKSITLARGSMTKKTGLLPGRYLLLKIRDTGHGMDKFTMERIYDPYFTTKKKGEGTGLGLSVVHGIVTRLKGAITVRSELGSGSEFKIYFPLAPAIKKQTRDKISKVSGGSEHILLVEDEMVICELIVRMLKSLGYEVTYRTSSIEALEAFRNRHDDFDLVLTDHFMPNMTGLALAAELKNIKADIPIIIATGYKDENLIEGTAQLGINKVILKPVAIKELAKAIRYTLDN